ncbi:MAG: GTP cyclohydrolase I FolE2 [Cyanobacteria bacterium HKST-UBA06]|nr:GTP cyclohydrolase I FolE2 [Cyanobacteria bacterium HKST-UBA06]
MNAISNTPTGQTDALTDVQNLHDDRGIQLQQVGVKGVAIPLTLLEKHGGTQSVHAKVALSVHLDKRLKGTHMSRFVILLAEWSREQSFSHNLKAFLGEMQARLKAESAHIRIDFDYFIDKAAPVTKLAAPMAYPCFFEARLDGGKNGRYSFLMGVEAAISTCCPCSKEISDYGAHNQRTLVRTKIQLDVDDDQPIVWIEDVAQLIDDCASCPVYPILKRVDEKYVTERQYDNPKFVEDVMRDTIAAFEAQPAIAGFEVEVEALESIHGHNAWAYENRLKPTPATPPSPANDLP